MSYDVEEQEAWDAESVRELEALSDAKAAEDAAALSEMADADGREDEREPINKVEAPLRRCMGRLIINKHFLFNEPEKEILTQIFDKFFPIAVDHHYHMDEVVYTGFSHAFDPVVEAGIIPLYRVIFVKHGGDRIFNGFEMVDTDFIQNLPLEEGTTDLIRKYS